MNAKKIVTAGLALVMVAGISVAGTLAWLTSTTGEVRNTFVVGDGVSITLDEAPVDENGKKIDGNRRTENSYTLAPGGEYDKDPTVHVTGDDCWVFVKVENGIPEGAEGDTTIASQIATNWTPVSGHDGVYYYGKSAEPTIVSKGTDCVVFETFSIAGTLDNDTYKALKNTNITITGFAIQAAEMDLDTAISQLPTGW